MIIIYILAQNVPKDSKALVEEKRGNFNHIFRFNKFNQIIDSLILEELVNGLKHFLFYMPRNQRALLPDGIEAAVPEEESNRIDGGYVTPISRIASVTYAHGSHKRLRTFVDGGPDEDNAHSLVEIRNAVDPSICHKMKVILK